MLSEVREIDFVQWFAVREKAGIGGCNNCVTAVTSSTMFGYFEDDELLAICSLENSKREEFQNKEWLKPLLDYEDILEADQIFELVSIRKGSGVKLVDGLIENRSNIMLVDVKTGSYHSYFDGIGFGILSQYNVLGSNESRVLMAKE